MWNIKKILIAVLSFSLLFAVSCDNEGKTGGGGTGGGGSSGGSQSKSELVGTTWRAREGGALAPSFTIDAEGNIQRKGGTSSGMSWTYTGKIADTFDYPYTVEVVATYNTETLKGTFIFNSASECLTTTLYYNGIGKEWYEVKETYYKE